jgi:hypothetical protein
MVSKFYNLCGRKWLVNFTIFVAVLIAMIDLGNLLYQFLGNAITLRFLLKAALLLLVMGLIFYYYMRDLKQQWTRMQLRVLLWAMIMVAVLTVGYGVYQIEKAFFISTHTLYCGWKTLPVTPEEDKVMQKLVSQIAAQEGCGVGSNCLNKWKVNGATYFSIAWATGNCGNGTTFQCSNSGNDVCCWSMNMPYQKVCLPNIAK